MLCSDLQGFIDIDQAEADIAHLWGELLNLCW